MNHLKISLLFLWWVGGSFSLAEAVCNDTLYNQCFIALGDCTAGSPPTNEQCNCWRFFRGCVISVDCYDARRQKMVHDNCLYLECPPHILDCNIDDTPSSGASNNRCSFYVLITLTYDLILSHIYSYYDVAI